MEHGGAGKLESGSCVVKEVTVESLADKGEESTGEVENYPEEPERSGEENPIDESFESEEEEVRGENFDPVNTNFHLNYNVFVIYCNGVRPAAIEMIFGPAQARKIKFWLAFTN